MRIEHDRHVPSFLHRIDVSIDKAQSRDGIHVKRDNSLECACRDVHDSQGILSAAETDKASWLDFSQLAQVVES